MVSERDIEIVRSDWEKVELIADTAATLLYDRLFSLDPGIRLLFPLDLEEQKLKVLRMLGASIYGLSDPEVLIPILHLLGRKHFAFGVRAQDYDTLAEALLWTLQRGLGDAFDASHEVAWKRVYAELAAHMQADLPLDS